MKRLLTLMTALVVATVSYAATIVVTEGVIETNTTWTNDNVYILDGFVAVNDGVVLTIEEGTIIKGRKASKGTLIIMRGGKIDAEGTACQPIVFTSEQPVGARTYGDWGGVIILGRAPINELGGINTIEGGVPNTLIGKTTGNTISDVNRYGGSNPPDNSGTLKYVRIEFPGIPFTVDNEINGLTMGGVGSGTTIEYVQVSFSGDDSFEWFGGTVNCKHLIAHRGLDDDWDTDEGFNGTIQFGVSLRDPAVADAAGTSEGTESDSDSGSPDIQPRTSAKLINITHIGPIQNPGDVISSFYRRGQRVRRGSSQSTYNSIWLGYPTGIEVDGSASLAQYDADSTQFKNNILAGHTDTYNRTDGSTSIDTKMATEGNIDLGPAGTGLVGLVDPYNLTNPNFLPTPGSLPLTAPDYDGLPFGFIEDVEYIGAFGTVDWTREWAEFDPNNVDYDAFASGVDYNPTISGSASGGSACLNGAIDITPAGGRGGAYSYLWSNGANTQDLSGVLPGAYSVTVSRNGCSASANYNIANSVPAPTGLSSTVLGSGNVSLAWTPVANTVAYEVRGTRISPAGPSGVLRKVVANPSGATVPAGQLTPGATYEWDVRVACSTSPVIATPRSATDNFTAATARLADVATLAVFPNPATETAVVTFNAQVDGDVIFRIVDLSGKTVASQRMVAAAGANNAQFDVTGLAAGAYTIEVAQGMLVETLNLQVQ